MFRRIKNLWNLSRYRVQVDQELRSSGWVVHEPRLVDDGLPKGKARIVEIKNPYNPMDDFNETDK